MGGLSLRGHGKNEGRLRFSDGLICGNSNKNQKDPCIESRR